MVELGKEYKFKEPKEPQDPTKIIQMKKYEVELKNLIAKKERYELEKHNLFGSILQVCDPVFRRKIKDLKDEYDDLYKDDNVIGLLALIRKFVYGAKGEEYVYVTMHKAMKALMMMRQSEKESLEHYGARFQEQLEMTEELWGDLSPMKEKGTALEAQSACRSKFLAMVYLAGVDMKRYRVAVNKMHNDHVNGCGVYPDDWCDVKKRLDNQKGGGKNKPNDLSAMMTFAQAGFKGKCWKCGKAGHTKQQCPEKEAELLLE